MNTRLAFEWLVSQFDVERLGWVLLHSLWQFTLVALLAATVVRTLRRKSSALRYGVLVASMAISVAAPAVTWIFLPNDRPWPVASQDAISPVQHVHDASEEGSFPLESETPFVVLPMAAGDLTMPELRPAEPVQSPAIRQPGPPWSERATMALRPWLAWIVVAWSLGVVICSTRPLFGWRTLHRLRRVGVSPVPDDVLIALGRLSRQLGLPHTVQLLQSTLAQMPIVVGYFRPVILLPVSLLTNVPAAQLEAILVHELAHIRQHDFVVNLLQVVAETLFFYHPALWWISHQIRIEREHCCDDLVVQLLGNRVEYGRALVAVEQLRGRGSALALSAGGGSLLSRIRRLGSGPAAESRRVVWCGGFAAILACSIGCTLLFSSTLNGLVKTECARVVLPDGSTIGLLGVTSDGTDPARWWGADGTPLDGHPLAGHRTTSQPDWGTRRRFAVRSTGAQRVAWFFPGDGQYQSSGTEGGQPDYLREEVIAPLALPLLEPMTIECGVGEGDFGPWAIIGTYGYPKSVPKTSPELALYYQQISTGCSVYAVEDDAANITLTFPSYKYIADQEWVIVAKGGQRWPATRSATRSDFSSSTFEITFSVPPDGIDHFEFRLRPYRHWVTFENVSLQRGQKTEVKVATAPPRPEVNAISEAAPEDNASQQLGSFVATILTERKRGEKANGQRENGPGPADKGEADMIRGLGTGIVIDGREYIATMRHFVESAARIRVSLSGDQTYEARLVGSDIKRDIAVLKIDSPRSLKPASFGMSSKLKKTEPVTMIGWDQERRFQLAKGTVTELGQHIEMNPQTSHSNLIQTDIPINPAQGGAPLMNSNGQVVGIMLALRAGTQKVSFALPVDDLLPVFKRIVEADTGTVSNDENEAAQGVLLFRGAGQAFVVEQEEAKQDKNDAPIVRRPLSPTFVLPDHLNVVAVGFDREGTELVSLSTENDVAVRVWEPDITLRVWDPDRKKPKREVKLDTAKHGNIFLQGQPMLSGDRRHVIAILDRQVTIWDANTGKLVKILGPPQEMQNSVLRNLAATPDLSLIACSRAPGFSGIDIADADAIVWDVAAGRVLRTVSHARALQIQSLALSPDGKFLATGGQEAGLCLWDLGTGKLLYQLPNDNAGKQHPNPEVSAGGANQVLSLRFSPDGRQLALGDMLGVKMLEASTGKLLFQCEAPFRYGRSGFVFSKGGQMFARIATDKTVPIWSARTGTLLAELPTEAHDGTFSDDNHSFVVGFTDSKLGLAVWPLVSGTAKPNTNSMNATSTQKLVAKFPSGHSVEFVGMTRNTLSAKSGWRPDGQAMGDVPEFKATLGGRRATGEFAGTEPVEDENARDFLFEFRGLRQEPSIRFELPFGTPIFAQEPIRDSLLRIRVFASLKDKEHPYPDPASRPQPHSLRVGLTDEPWGPWQQISETGKLLNNLGKNKLYQSHYSQIGFKIGSSGGFPDDTMLVLRHPQQYDRLYAFEMRVIDTEGEVVRGLDWRRQAVEGTTLEDFGWYLTQPLPKGKQLARFEYRLRPYRHWVTFENVSLVPGQQTDVKVNVKSLTDEETNQPTNANGDMRSNPPAGSGDPRPAQETPVKEVDLLQGEWAVTGWQEAGENASANELKGKKFKIQGNDFIGVEPSLSGRMSFKLNHEKVPKEIDLTVLDGKRKGITDLGIYEIKGLTLRICFGENLRPKHFVSTTGNGETLLTLQKAPGDNGPGQQADVKVKVEAVDPLVPPQAAQRSERGAGDWGPMANGLRARVVPVLSSMSEDAIDPAQRVTKFVKADDIAFVFELENVSDKPIKLVDLWHDAKNGKPIQDADWLSQFVCSVVLLDRDGKLIEQPEIEVGEPMFLFHEAQVATLQPGKTQQFLIKTVRWLPTFKPRIQPGSYRVAVRYQWLSGPNAARIREANPRSSLLEAAAVNVVSAAVAIEVGGESRKADLVWGEAINGLRAAVSFEPSKATHTHGEKLVVNLNLQNVGTQPLKLVSDLWLPDAGATIENDEGEPVDLDDSNGGLSPRMSGLLTLKPQQVVALEAGDLGLAISKEQATELDERTIRKLIAPAGKYSMQLETSFRDVLNRRSVGGQNSILVKDAWVGKLKTGAAPLTITSAPVVGLEFLKPYPKLHGLSLDMTEPQFLEIVKRQELKTRKTVDGEKVTHHIELGDGHTLIVMFDKDAKCSGIQRVRGEHAANQSVEVRFVGGPKSEPLPNVKVEFTTGHGGDKKSFGTFTTDDAGWLKTELPVGFYYLHLSSEKEWPYLTFEKSRTESSFGHSRELNVHVTEQGVEKWLDGKRRESGFEAATKERPARITFTLEPAVEFVLRAIDIETGKGILGADFYEEVAAGEDWAHRIYGDNLGSKFAYGYKATTESKNLTDKEGHLRRWVGEKSEESKFGVWKAPAGYELVEPKSEVAVITKLGQARAEQVFRFRRIQPVRREDKPVGPHELRVLKKPAMLLPDHGIVQAVGFDTDAKELTTASIESFITIRRWDVVGKKLISEIKLQVDKQGRAVREGTFVFSADRRRLVAATDEYVGIWETSTGKLLKQLPFKTKEGIYACVIDMLDCTPDLSLIVGHRALPGRLTRSYDANVFVWDGISGNVLRTVIDKGATDLKAIDLSTDGKRLVTTNSGGAKIWETSTGQLLRSIPNDNAGRKDFDPVYSNLVWSVQFSPDGKQVAMGDIMGMKLLDTTSGKLLQQLEGPYRFSSGGRPGLVFSKDGQWLARLGTKYTHEGEHHGYVVPIWSTRTGAKYFELHTQANDAAFSDDGQRLAVAFSDMQQALSVWSLNVDAANKEAPGKQVELLHGEWAVAAWQEEGENANADELKGKKMVITRDRNSQ